MVNLFICRHGETDYNRLGIVQGGGIDSDLNEAGHLQAKALFDQYQHISFSAIYASGLKRTHQTLAPWNTLGYEIAAIPGLNEFGWGILEGKKPDSQQEHVFKSTLASWRAGDVHIRMEGGENPIEAWERSKPFFDRIREEHQHQNILVCSHGRQMRVMISSLLGIGLHEMDRYKPSNTGMFKLRIDPHGHTEIDLANDISHLEGFIQSL